MIKSRRERTDSDSWKCCINCRHLKYKKGPGGKYYACGIDGAQLGFVNSLTATVCDKHVKSEEGKR